MVNDEISDISEGGVALGENKFEESFLLDEGIKAGMLVKQTATGIAKFAYGPGGDPMGVMKEHEEFDLDTEVTAAKYGDVISEGYVAIFIEAAGSIHYPGSIMYGSYTGGSLGWTLVGSEEPIAVLKKEIAADDTVAIVKLLR